MNSLAFEPARALDHLVLPTASLETARARLTALGFTVAPVGIHPFGTENACVYFADGTFLEPLAVRDERVAREAARLGNVFVARDAAYRHRRGDDGFSALVFATTDAERDHAEFEAGGVSAGKMLDFSREFIDAAGRSGTASFRLAFAADLRAPDAFFFTCQRINAPKVDRASLQAHANGATQIRNVVLSANEPNDYADIVLLASGATMTEPSASHRRLAAGNGTIEILGKLALKSEYGLAEFDDPGLHLRAVVFGVGDLAATERLLKNTAIDYEKRGSRLAVPPAPGQGAAFAFEEIS